MSTDETTLRERLAAVLAVHREDATWPDTCLCETEVRDFGSEGHFAAHLADTLLPVVAHEVAAAQAERITRAEEDANRAIDRRREETARANAAERKVADAWAAIPPYIASDYDRGRVDQREMCETELRAALGGD